MQMSLVLSNSCVGPDYHDGVFRIVILMSFPKSQMTIRFSRLRVFPVANVKDGDRDH